MASITKLLGVGEDEPSYSKGRATHPLSVTTGPAFILPIRSTGFSQPIFCKSALAGVSVRPSPFLQHHPVRNIERNVLWKTLAHANGATSIGTPCFQFVPSTLESLRESATRMNVSAASARTFSRSWHLRMRGW